MHMFPFQSSSPWYNHNFFLNSGFVSQTCALGTSNNSWQADLLCAWRRFVAYVCMCGFGCGDAQSSVFIHLEVRGWRLMSSSFNPHLIFLLCPYTCAMTHVWLSGDNFLLPRGFHVEFSSSGLADWAILPTFHCLFWEEGLSFILKYPELARIVGQWISYIFPSLPLTLRTGTTDTVTMTSFYIGFCDLTQVFIITQQTLCWKHHLLALVLHCYDFMKRHFFSLTNHTKNLRRQS